MTIDGETWFVAADVCAVLEHSNPTRAVERLDDDERGLTTIQAYTGNDHSVNVVSESGLYALVFTSRKSEAKAFRRWVTGEVLPSIRKTGRYQAGEEAPVESCAEAKPQVAAPSVVLPGPGRYIAMVLPDGTVNLRATAYDGMLDEMTATDAQILCHHFKVIEGYWNGIQQQRSVGMDPFDTFVYRALETTIRQGGELADHHLRFQDILKR